jgi:tRNA A-37 threonylcarbamoyl transferase component Bud32
MSPSARRALSIAIAVVSLAAAAIANSSLGQAEAEARAAKANAAAKEKARALQETLKGETDRLLRTAGAGATNAKLRAMIKGEVNKETLQDVFENEADWKEYRTPPLQSACFVGDELWVRTSHEGPTDAQALAFAKKADAAGHAELAWAAEGLWAVAAVRLPDVIPGDPPKVVVLYFARSVDLGTLPGTWVLTDGKQVLGRHGDDPEQAALLSAVGHEREGARSVATGGAAAVELMPGVWLWAAEAAPSSSGGGTRPIALFAGAALVALVALALGFRKPAAPPPSATQTMPGLSVSPPFDRTAMSMPAGTLKYGQPDNVQPSRYQVIAPLGEGGMARVFLAVTRGAEGFSRIFVVKRLRPELLGVPESVTQFIDEARLGSKLVHSNIVPVFDFGRDAEGYYLAQEYIQGRDLDNLRKASLDRRRQPLEPEVVLFVAREALRALAYAHGAGLVHRDVSPNNLMISSRGEVKLLDLGIAKSNTNLTKTQAGMVKGNVFYMSPEQARGEPVDARADLFSLGLVLFTAVTGDTLYTGASNYELLNRAANGLSAPDWERVKKLPPAISALLDTVLQSNPADRFADADAFAAAIPPSAVGTAQQLEALMQSLFSEEFQREQETLQQAHQQA